MTTSSTPTMLVYGATGKAGRLVVEHALAQGFTVSAFVRNPDKVPEALRAKVTLVKGDLRDAASVGAAVRACRPNAIIDASGSLPIGHAKGQAPNNADRNVLTRATVAALQTDGRLAECVLVIIGGQLVPEPGGTINSWSVAAMAWVLRTFVARKVFREAEETLRWCFDGAPSGFRFIYARMGYMVEAPSRGTLRAEATLANIQRGSASYCDVADALVALSSDTTRRWENQAIFFNYIAHAAPSAA